MTATTFSLLGLSFLSHSEFRTRGASNLSTWDTKRKSSHIKFLRRSLSYSVFSEVFKKRCKRNVISCHRFIHFWRHFKKCQPTHRQITHVTNFIRVTFKSRQQKRVLTAIRSFMFNTIEYKKAIFFSLDVNLSNSRASVVNYTTSRQTEAAKLHMNNNKKRTKWKRKRITSGFSVLSSQGNAEALFLLRAHSF